MSAPTADARPGRIDPSAHLVHMANQIGEYFGAFPDRAEALEGIAQHIGKFWAPRMRRQLLAHLDGPAGGAGLQPLVREAVVSHRAALTPAGSAGSA